ncbi:MAG: spermidine/putrescine ABC transporter substrate-binding protein, partial [Ilumatobacteraceae bacterium]
MRTTKLKLAGVAVAGAMLLAACGGGDDASSAAACEVGTTDGDLYLYNWSEYIDPDLKTAFEEQYGVAVIED